MSAKTAEIGDIWRHFGMDGETYYLIIAFPYVRQVPFARLLKLTGPGNWGMHPIQVLNNSTSWSYMA